MLTEEGNEGKLPVVERLHTQHLATRNASLPEIAYSRIGHISNDIRGELSRYIQNIISPASKNRSGTANVGDHIVSIVGNTVRLPLAALFSMGWHGAGAVKDMGFRILKGTGKIAANVLLHTPFLPLGPTASRGPK